MKHADYMKLAINEAIKAEQKEEIPIGAVLVSASGDILSAAHNLTINFCDPTAHAEILALRESANKILNYRLLNTTMYVTLEPCVMCMGAIIHARIDTIVFGAFDPKWGAAGSVYNFANDERFNHKPKIVSNVCYDECLILIQNFFQKKRKHVARDSNMT